MANIADDLIIHGRGEEQHDKRLLAVLDRLRETGLTLNEDKCEFRLPRLTFFGHEVARTGIEPSEETLMSRIERKYCLTSTSYLAGLFDIFIFLHI